VTLVLVFPLPHADFRARRVPACAPTNADITSFRDRRTSHVTSCAMYHPGTATAPHGTSQMRHAVVTERLYVLDLDQVRYLPIGALPNVISPDPSAISDAIPSRDTGQLGRYPQAITGDPEQRSLMACPARTLPACSLAR